MIIIEKILDIQTGEETVIEREETADEQKFRLDSQAFFAQEQAEAETKQAARQPILDRLGLTADEAALLLG
jgi:hypothetical protein